MHTALDVRNAHKAFGDTRALSGAELVLHSGEWLGLLGPNGAGKTTLVRAIAGRVRLDEGAVRLLDTQIAGARHGLNHLRLLGIVPQDIALYPLLTATENLAAWGALHGLQGRTLRERVDWALDWTGLADRATEPCGRFSGGMKRRLNIACSVLHQPRVILLDEPTVGVDPQSRQRIWDMLGELRAQGASLMLTTHQLDEAQTVCDRIVIIDHGRTIASGTLSELLRDTIGTRRTVTLALQEPAPPSIADHGFTVQDVHTVSREVADIARDLPELLKVLSAAGLTVCDIHVDAPSLQAVFLYLTGRSLRE